MSNVRTDFASLIPPKELLRLLYVSPLNPTGLPPEKFVGVSEKELEAAALKDLPALDKKHFTPKVFGGGAYCGYAKKELTSEADVRSKLQQKAEAKGIELSSEHLDKLIAALKSTDPLSGDIKVFLLFILETPKI